MLLSLACTDWEARIRSGRSLITPAALKINPGEAERAVSIFNKLRLPDVAGMPALAEASGDWFREIVAALLGSLDPVTGARIIREVFALVPKKNAKTSYGAGLMVTALLMNRRPRAEFLFVGPTQAVSDLAFDQASGMIENDPDGFLQKRMHIKGHLKTITDRRTKAELKIKTFDAAVLTGVKPVGVLIDELHEISKNSRAAKIIGQLRGGLVANPEGFLFFITTQSDEPPAGAFKSELQMARAIRDGRAQGAMLPVLYEFPPAIVKDHGEPPAWQRPDNWPMVLPNLGKSISLPRLIEDFKTAVEKGEEETRRWCSQHLNIEIGVGLGSDSWIGADYWPNAADPSLTLDELLSRSEVAVVAIDGGGLDDLLGLAVIGRCKTTRDWLLWNHAWAHTDVLRRRKEITPQLQDFMQDGDLTLCADDDPTQDVREAADVVERVRAAGLLPEKQGVGLDPVGVAAIIDELASRKIEGEQVVAIPQGYRLSGAVWGMERKLKDGTLWHSGSPMMSWCVGNAKIEQKGNAVLITKQTAGKAKIDPLVAAFDAAMLMSRNPEAAAKREFQMMFV